MTKYVSPIGRIVQGNPLIANPQFDDRTKQPKLGADGNQLNNWYINVAFDKRDPNTAPMIQAIYEEAARAFPALFPFGYQAVARADTQPPIHAGGCIRNDFAFKIKDGDGFDANGQPHSKKEGWAGQWIVQVSTYAGAMRVVDGNKNNAPVTEVGLGPNHIKTGDFVVVALDFKSNGWKGDAQSKPGLYMNPDLVQLVGYGDAIVGGPDANEVFKNVDRSFVPAGMSTVPTAGAMPGLPAPIQPAGSAGALPGLPASPALPLVAAAAPQYVISPEAAAQGLTKESLNAQGHTDESLIAHGYLVPAPAAAAVALPSLAPALPGLAASPALPVIPNHALVTNVLATPQFIIAPAVAQQGHTIESLLAAGHTHEALLTAGYITKA